MFNTIPTAPISMVKDVPPILIKGRATPVAGIDDVATSIFNAACIPICAPIPITTIHENISGHLSAIHTHLYTNTKNNIITTMQPTRPNSSPIMANIKSFCGSGM